jgi:hypothetical protein
VQEIEEEENAERVAATATLFKQLAARCQARDGGDFWPTAVSQAAGVLPSSTSHATAPASTPVSFNILEELLRPSTTATTSTAEHTSTTEELKLHHSIEDLSELQDYSQPTTTTTTATTTAAPAITTTPSSPPVIYITWDDVRSHLFHTLQQTVQFVASTVEERSGESPLICAAREQQQWVTKAALETVDSTREWCRGTVVWPQIEVRRISALRYRVDWHGVTFPVRNILSFSKMQHLKAVDLTHTP